MMELFNVKTNKKKAIKSKFTITRSIFYCQYEIEQPAKEVKIPRLSLKLGSKIRTCQSQQKIIVSYKKTSFIYLFIYLFDTLFN